MFEYRVAVKRRIVTTILAVVVYALALQLYTFVFKMKFCIAVDKVYAGLYPH